MRVNVSVGLTAAACTAMRTSPTPAWRSGSSNTRNASGPPYPPSPDTPTTRMGRAYQVTGTAPVVAGDVGVAASTDFNVWAAPSSAADSNGTTILALLLSANFDSASSCRMATSVGSGSPRLIGP